MPPPSTIDMSEYTTRSRSDFVDCGRGEAAKVAAKAVLFSWMDSSLCLCASVPLPSVGVRVAAAVNLGGDY